MVPEDPFWVREAIGRTTTVEEAGNIYKPHNAPIMTAYYGLISKSCNLATGCHSTTNSSKDILCGRRVFCSMQYQLLL
jgi:hypothetical protein